jgi:serine/threonine protein kinase
MDSTHKNIVSVFDYGHLSHYIYFIDMELCDLNLERWIYKSWNERAARRLPHLAIDLPPRARMGQVWDIMEDITRAVAFIHEHRSVHRDLKPSNGFNKLLDHSDFCSFVFVGK